MQRGGVYRSDAPVRRAATISPPTRQSLIIDAGPKSWLPQAMVRRNRFGSLLVHWMFIILADMNM